MKKAIITSLIFLLASINLSVSAQWVQQNTNTIYKLHSIHFPKADTGFAVGYNGTIIKTDNGGSTWIVLSGNSVEDLKSVYFTDTKTGYAAGTNGTILKTENAGSTWTKLNSNTTQHINDIYFPLPHIGYAVGDNDLILKTTDYGTTWNTLPSGSSGYLSSTFFLNADTGFAVGTVGAAGAKILKTTNGGNSWTSFEKGLSGGLNDIYFTDKNTGYTVGYDGKILKTTNGGGNWTSLNSQTNSYLKSIHFPTPDTGYAVGFNNNLPVILKTTNAGINWTELSHNDSTYFFSVYFTNAHTGYIAGGILNYLHIGNETIIINKSCILKTTNGGISPIKIIQQPSNIYKQKNKSATFTTLVTGTAPINYQWYQNGILLEGQNTNTLNINNINIENEGFYSCKISNSAGEVTSDSAELMITDHIELIGDTILLSISNIKGSVQWEISSDTINWTEIPNAHDTTFTYISQASSNGKRYYRTKITDSLCPNIGSQYSHIIRNKVISNLSQLPVGIPFHNITLIPTDNNGNKIMITPNDIGRYSWGCEIETFANSYTDGYSNTEDIAFSCPEDSIAANICKNLELNNLTDWYLPSIQELQVLYQNKNLLEQLSYSYWSSTEYNKTTAYAKDMFSGINNYMLKTYNSAVRCFHKTESPISNTTLYCPVNYEQQPTTVHITKQPKNIVSCFHNDSSKFSIKLSGTPPYTYQWYKNQIIIEGANDSTLLISNTSLENEGLYHCQISNICRTVNSDSANLKITKLTSKIVCENDTICQGKNTQLYATYESNHPQNKIKYQWTNAFNLTNDTIPNPIASPDRSYAYQLNISDSLGCSTQNHINIFVSNVYANQQICFIEFDTITQKNKINWLYNSNIGIDSVIILKEISLNNWRAIGTVAYSNQYFIDTLSFPERNSDAYKIQVKDSCENTSQPTLQHTTITLLTSYTPSTNTLGFNWSHYLINNESIAPSYTIYGVDIEGKNHELGTISGSQNYYNWKNPQTNYIKFYIGFTTGCSEKTNYFVRSNYVSNLTSIEEKINSVPMKFYIKNNNIQIESVLPIEKIFIYNSIGETIQELSNTNNLTIHKTGIYILKIITKKGIITKKIII